MTPGGYTPIEDLKTGDQVSTKFGTTEIVKMVSFIGKNTEQALYLLPKNTLAPNIPLNDLYMSKNHAFKFQGKWHHMQCAAKTLKLKDDDIAYYHIITSDYFAHTLRAEGVEVETCFKYKGDKITMAWLCGNTKTGCIPLKCTLDAADKVNPLKCFKVLLPETLAKAKAPVEKQLIDLPARFAEGLFKSMFQTPSAQLQDTYQIRTANLLQTYASETAPALPGMYSGVQAALRKMQRQNNAHAHYKA